MEGLEGLSFDGGRSRGCAILAPALVKLSLLLDHDRAALLHVFPAPKRLSPTSCLRLQCLLHGTQLSRILKRSMSCYNSR